LSSSLEGALRRLEPQEAREPLAPRTGAELPLVTRDNGPGPELMLDTSVYLDVLQGRTPPEVDELLTLRVLNHSSVAMTELARLFGRLDPGAKGAAKTLEALTEVIEAIPGWRLGMPGIKTTGEAGILAGMAERLGAEGRSLVARATLLLHAAETGRVLLARRSQALDCLQQLAPRAQMLLYDRR
jgi:hypothetical protein